MGRFRFLILLVFALPINAQRVTPSFEALFTAREIPWRDEVLPAIERQESAHVDAEATQFVSGLGARLTYATPQEKALPCRFVLYDDSVGLQVPGFGLVKHRQADVLPGGIILVPLSLFLVATDEAEFSSALARAVAHVALKHRMWTTVRALASSPWKPFPTTLIFTRSFESEADRTAVEILARSGINPEAFVRYARNLRASFDTSDGRMRPIHKAISELPQRTYGPDQSFQFDALKRRQAAAPVRV